jgi:hypothetical protein
LFYEHLMPGSPHSMPQDAWPAARLSKADTAINGWDRQSQYDRSAEEALALAPS